MPIFACRAALFDMDGTLVDSFASAQRSWAKWSKSVGMDGSNIFVAGNHNNHGRQRPELIAELLPGISAQEAAEHAEAVRQMELHDTSDVVALPGAVELVSQLPDDSWAIVTACDADTAHARLGAANIPVPKHLVSADDLRAGKPDPAGYLRAAELLGVAPDDALVFEDAPAGVEAGVRAGMRCVATRWTTRDDMLSRACAVVDDPSHISVTVTDEGDLIFET